MKFLIKLEDAINKALFIIFHKMKGLTPPFFFKSKEYALHSLKTTKEKIPLILERIKSLARAVAGFFHHYLTKVRAQFIGISTYFRSDDFKQKKKSEILLLPFILAAHLCKEKILKNFKSQPFQTTATFLTALVSIFALYNITISAHKILLGTKSLRAPASIRSEEEPIIVFENLKFQVSENLELVLNITLTAHSIKDRDKIFPHEHEIEEELKALTLPVTQLPLGPKEKEAVEKEMGHALKEKFKLASINVEQVLPPRPAYFLQKEKMLTFSNYSLQIFLENTDRNNQVWVDFSVEADNRSTIIFLKENDALVRDHMNSFVEPIIPQLPINEEGRQIIKDKLKLELNEFLKKNGIEGKILNVYITYIIVS